MLMTVSLLTYAQEENLSHKTFEISCNYRGKKKKAFVLMLGLHDQNCHCSAPRAAKVQNTDPSVSCKEQLCADTQKHFKSAGTAAIRTPKPHNTNTQQHTHLTLLSHSCLTIAKQRADPSASQPSGWTPWHQQHWGWAGDPGAALH